MCNPACIEFAKRALVAEEVTGRKVIEVGSLDVNGSTRETALALGPSQYIGVDIEVGPGVDVLCDATNLVAWFGEESFHVVITTELLEHVRDWRSVISNMKQILKPEGVIIITTRSIGFAYHGYPYDFWRYELEDMQNIFGDFSVELLESDPRSPGVFVKARKPADFTERDLSSYQLHSIITHRLETGVGNHRIVWHGLRNPIPSIVFVRNWIFHMLGLPADRH